MTKKKEVKPREKPSQFGEKISYDQLVWCMNNLDKNVLDAHDARPYNPVEILDKANEMIEDGFQFSWKFDDYSKSRQVSAVCLYENQLNTGLAISARGEDVQDCMSIILYKYYNVAKRDLRQFTDVVPLPQRG